MTEPAASSLQPSDFYLQNTTGSESKVPSDTVYKGELVERQGLHKAEWIWGQRKESAPGITGPLEDDLVAN